MNLLTLIPLTYLFVWGLIYLVELPDHYFIKEVYFLASCFGVFLVSIFNYSLQSYRAKISSELLYLAILLILLIPIMVNGPFTMPPSDPLYHLNVMWRHAISSDRLVLLERKWNYILFFLLVKLKPPSSFHNALALINIYHYGIGIYLAISAYVSARLFSLKPLWSILAVILMFWFFGTNRFSYYSYYSVAPSAINMGLYWVLSALLFNKIRSIRTIQWAKISGVLYTTILIFLITPLMYRNHAQEAGFMLFTLFLAYSILLYKIIVLLKSKLWQKIIIPLAVFWLVILIFPQYKFYYLAQTAIELEDFYRVVRHGGTAWIWFFQEKRVWDTLGFFGMVPLVVGGVIILSGQFNIVSKARLQKLQYLLAGGILPFWILFIPFNLMLWSVSITAAEVLWRASYTSQAWILWSFLLYLFVDWCKQFFYHRHLPLVRQIELPIFISALIIFYLISGIRSAPFYGKRDFLAIPTKKFYNDLANRLGAAFSYDREQLFLSDPRSAFTLNALFGLKTNRMQRELSSFSGQGIDLQYLAKNPQVNSIVNLAGFPLAIWVAQETEHWHVDLWKTAHFYEYGNLKEGELVKQLRQQPMDNQLVLFPDK